MFTWESVIGTLIISSFTTAFGFMIYYLKARLKEKTESKAELKENKRVSFQKLLDEHSKLLLKLDNDIPMKDWIIEFNNMSKSILLWGSDDVLIEYGKYVENYSKNNFKIEERELHFANAILAFRKELGYKNKKEMITPEQVVLIFRSGYRGNI